MSDQPEALFIADVLAHDPQSRAHHHAAVDCLRHQHAEIAALKAECDALRTKSNASRAGVVATQGENERLRAERDALRTDYGKVCGLVADMHAAATGRPGEGPRLGVVEDVAAVRAERDALLAHLRYWIPDETMIPAGHEAAWESARAALDAAKEAGK